MVYLRVSPLKSENLSSRDTHTCVHRIHGACNWRVSSAGCLRHVPFLSIFVFSGGRMCTFRIQKDVHFQNFVEMHSVRCNMPSRSGRPSDRRRACLPSAGMSDCVGDICIGMTIDCFPVEHAVFTDQGTGPILNVHVELQCRMRRQWKG